MKPQSFDTDDGEAGVYFADAEKTQVLVADSHGNEVGPLIRDTARDLARAILALVGDE